MKLTKALSLILTLAMLLGTLALGVVAETTAEGTFADLPGTVLFKYLYQTDDGSNGYVAPTDENRTEIPANAMTMTALKESGKKTNTIAVADRHFTISNADEMVIFSELVNASDPFYMANVYLTGNIDMTSVANFTPIGNTQTTEGAGPAYYFRGVFDGRGYEIQNLKMTSNGGDYTNVALFGCIRGAAIINLVIADSCSFTYTGTSSTARTASIAAWTVSVGGDGDGADANASGYAVGAYYGWAADNNNHASTVTAKITSLICNVKNNATVNGGAGYAGGIVATTNAHTGYRAMIMKCTQAADVTGNVAGGILGAMLGNNASRIVQVIECQVKANSNKTVKIIGNTVDACGNAILGSIDKGNFGDFNSAEVRNSSTGFDYDVRGYSFKNVKRVDTSAMPNLNDYDSNTSAASFKITNAAGMLKLATLVNDGNKLSGKTIYLANDIDWAADENKDVAMVTIGGDSAKTAPSSYNRDSANYFSGTFDGQGYVIDNLKMNFTATIAGLFGVLRAGGTVKNMVLGEGCEFISTGSYVAPIAGMCVYGGHEVQVVNCYSAATVTKLNNNGVAAGMVATVGGYTNAAYAKILYCTNAGNVTAGWTVGAMLGYADRPAYVNYCVNTGSVTATAGDGTEAGVMVGNFQGASGQFVNNLTTTAVSSPNPSNAFDGFFGKRAGSWVQTGSISPANSDAASIAILNQVASGLNYAGYQTKTEGGKVTAVRILATVNSLEAAKVGFMLSANDEIYDYSTTTVYGSVLASNDGLEYSVQAETLGGKYVVAVTITGIPAESTTITLVPYADSNYGAEVSIELN